MKKVLLLMLCIMLAFVGCTEKDNTKEPDANPEADSSQNTDEDVTDETKDRYGREYVDDKIVIPSNELRELLLNFWTRFSLGDAECVDDMYLEEGKAKALKAILSTDDGTKMLAKLCEKIELSSEGIPDAVFGKSDLDENGNAFNNQSDTEVVLSGPCYRNFLDTVAIKNDVRIKTAKELLDYIDRYNQYYPAVERHSGSVRFVYVNGKPAIDGNIFLESFGIFNDISDSDTSISDLLKNTELKPATVDGDLAKLVEYIRSNEYIWVYELLRKTGTLEKLSYSPNAAVKVLYSQSEEVRNNFLNSMRNLPTPLVKVYEDKGQTKIRGIYYYPASYGYMGTGEIAEGKFEMTSLESFDGIMVERIVKNILVSIGVDAEKFTIGE